MYRDTWSWSHIQQWSGFIPSFTLRDIIADNTWGTIYVALNWNQLKSRKPQALYYFPETNIFYLFVKEELNHFKTHGKELER